MAQLIYSAIASLDGRTTGPDGGFDWAAPSDEVHAFINDRERSVGTYLYGRRMYETMRYWEDPPGLDSGEDHGPAADYAAIWQAADKLVVSSTLTEATTRRTRLVKSLDPEQIRTLVAESSADVSIGGPQLANAALAAGLVHRLQLYVIPVVVGGGTRWLGDGFDAPLRLVDQHRFGNGTLFLDYELHRPGLPDPRRSERERVGAS